MDIGPFVAIGAVAVLTISGQVLWPRGSRWPLSRAPVLRPHTRISEAAGAVRVTGRVCSTEELLQAPLTGTSALVSLSGTATREVDPTGESPDLRSPPERIVLRGDENEPLLISTLVS